MSEFPVGLNGKEENMEDARYLAEMFRRGLKRDAEFGQDIDAREVDFRRQVRKTHEELKRLCAKSEKHLELLAQIERDYPWILRGETDQINGIPLT